MVGSLIEMAGNCSAYSDTYCTATCNKFITELVIFTLQEIDLVIVDMAGTLCGCEFCGTVKYGLLTKCEVKIWILAKFFFCVFMDRDEWRMVNATLATRAFCLRGGDNLTFQIARAIFQLFLVRAREVQTFKIRAPDSVTGRMSWYSLKLRSFLQLTGTESSIIYLFLTNRERLTEFRGCTLS